MNGTLISPASTLQPRPSSGLKAEAGSRSRDTASPWAAPRGGPNPLCRAGITGVERSAAAAGPGRTTTDEGLSRTQSDFSKPFEDHVELR
ncbi:unnamed protein product [Arctogadus glacialis]